MCVATFMLLLDITIVNVALPKIQQDFKATLADLQWVIDAYALSLASLMLTSGSIADLQGRRRIFMVGLGVFTVASFLCGLSTSALFLNLARALQGVGGAMMFATSLALLAGAFSGREIRVIVKPEDVGDERAALISHQIARDVEKELEYPGQIKVTVIRESRAIDFAK